MPDLKISQLPPASTPLAGTELVPIVQGGTTDQTTVQAILTSAVPSGTANGVLFLNGSKVVTSGSALTFDGTTLLVNRAASTATVDINASDTTSTSFLRLQDFGVTRAWFASYRDGSGKTELLGNGFLTFALGGGTSPSEQMRLTSTGLGIGTSSPGAKLQVLAIGKATIFGSATAQNSYSAWQYNGADVGYIGNAAGVVGVAGATDFGITAFTGGKLWLGANNGTGTTYAVLDSSGNLGLGVTPSAWNTSFKALEYSAGYVAAISTSELDIGQNNFYSASLGTWAYKNTAGATQYRQTGSEHRWYTAPSGTAGNAISFTQAMTLDASGNLGIGSTSPASAIHAQRASGAEIYLQLAQTGVASWQIGMSASSNGLAFLQSGSEKIRIKETGQLRFVPLSSDPAGAENGDVYYNSSTNKLRVYNGTAWVDLH